MDNTLRAIFQIITPYIEEVIHSLIEADILVRDKDGWILQESISRSNIPPTIQGVISGRIDRLARTNGVAILTETGSR